MAGFTQGILGRQCQTYCHLRRQILIDVSPLQERYFDNEPVGYCRGEGGGVLRRCPYYSTPLPPQVTYVIVTSKCTYVHRFVGLFAWWKQAFGQQRHRNHRARRLHGFGVPLTPVSMRMRNKVPFVPGYTCDTVSIVRHVGPDAVTTHLYV